MLARNYRTLPFLRIGQRTVLRRAGRQDAYATGRRAQNLTRRCVTKSLWPCDITAALPKLGGAHGPLSCASSLYGAGPTADHYAHAKVQLHHYDLMVERTIGEACSAGSCAPGPTAVLVTGGGCVVAAGRRSPFLRPCSATVTPVTVRVPPFYRGG